MCKVELPVIFEWIDLKQILNQYNNQRTVIVVVKNETGEEDELLYEENYMCQQLPQ